MIPETLHKQVIQSIYPRLQVWATGTTVRHNYQFLAAKERARSQLLGIAELFVDDEYYTSLINEEIILINKLEFSAVPLGAAGRVALGSAENLRAGGVQ